MMIIGIDPGFDRIGWSVGQALRDNQLRLLSFGLIETKKTDTLWQRYSQIDDELTALAHEYHIQEAALESLFFFKNQKTVIRVAEARGVILSALLRAKVEIFEYSPPQIKMAVAGFGRADKKAMEKMVRLQLHLDKILPNKSDKIIDDTYDAMAVLLTHVGARKLKKVVS